MQLPSDLIGCILKRLNELVCLGRDILTELGGSPVVSPHALDGHLVVIPAVDNAVQTVVFNGTMDSVSLHNLSGEWVRLNFSVSPGITAGNRYTLLAPGSSKNVTFKGDVITSVAMQVVNLPAVSTEASLIVPVLTFSADAAIEVMGIEE